MVTNNALFDNDFLLQLDNSNDKKNYVRIISLDYNDQPQEIIEGIVQSGNINIDGASALRRSCSLSLQVLPDTIFTDVYWALTNQFKLEIGVENTINEKYPPIIWFKQGTFIISSFSKTENATGITVSISGQDKMCTLNGKVGGTFPEDLADLSVIEIVDKNGEKIDEEPVPLYTIVLSTLLQYGNERLDKIIIDDLAKYGQEELKYEGSEPIYLIYEPPGEEMYGTGGIFRSVVIDDTTPVWTSKGRILISDVPHYYVLNAADSRQNKNATKVAYTEKGVKNCVVIQLQYGETIGYRPQQLIYGGGKLEVKSGSNIVGVFDKIKNMLGEFEYFYDLNGNFVFQEKKNYINSLFSPATGDIIEPSMLISPYSYVFNDFSKITNISYSPQLDNLKNDFTIWGERQGASQKLPIHVRYAIDKKPTYYYNYKGTYFYYTSSYSGKNSTSAINVKCDWRELIYQMARDYSRYNGEYNFFRTIRKRNYYIGDDGKTGYETYYASLEAFWRQLYCIKDHCDTSELPIRYSLDDYYDKGHKYEYWCKNVYTNPNELLFWFDFLDIGDGPLLKLNKRSCGMRSVVNTTKQTSTIFSNRTPDIVFYTNDTKDSIGKLGGGYSYIWIPETVNNLFTKTAQAPSLVSQINELIYRHCCCQESVSFTTLPIYYLEPNTRIYVEGIGDLIVTKISYALGHSATMSLSCTKVVDSIY